MKKRILSLLLVFVMLCGMLPVTAAAADNTATLTDTFLGSANATVTFSVSGATVSSYSYAADTNTMSIVVTDVTNTNVTLNAATTSLRFTPESASVDVSSGSGSVQFRIFGQTPQQGENIIVNVTKIDGSGGSGGEGAADSINITMTFADGGQIVEVDNQKLYNAEVEVSDRNNDGKLTIGEAFAAFHDMYYTGGAEAGYAETSNDSVTGWVTKFWGKGSTCFSYALNYGWAHSTQDEIKADDQLTAYFGQATDYLDLLVWFDEESYMAEAGTELGFSVNGISIYKSGKNGNATAVPVGATVKSMMTTMRLFRA